MIPTSSSHPLMIPTSSSHPTFHNVQLSVCHPRKDSSRLVAGIFSNSSLWALACPCSYILASVSSPKMKRIRYETGLSLQVECGKRELKDTTVSRVSSILTAASTAKIFPAATSMEIHRKLRPVAECTCQRQYRHSASLACSLWLQRPWGEN